MNLNLQTIALCFAVGSSIVSAVGCFWKLRYDADKNKEWQAEHEKKNENAFNRIDVSRRDDKKEFREDLVKIERRIFTSEGQSRFVPMGDCENYRTSFTAYSEKYFHSHERMLQDHYSQSSKERKELMDLVTKLDKTVAVLANKEGLK